MQSTFINKGVFSPFPVFAFAISILFCSYAKCFANAEEDITTIKIGILAQRGKKQCYTNWNPTAQYLTNKLQDKNFIIKPLDFHEVYPAIEDQSIDFIFANPFIYVEAENLYGISRILTLIAKQHKHSSTYSSVIFYKSNQEDIVDIHYLKGKTLMAVHEKSFGGYIMALRELHDAGIYISDFKKIVFAGTHDNVVYGIKNKIADIGIVRCDTLERMAEEGKISLKDFKIIHSNTHTHTQKNRPCSFLHSSRSYPEWPLAKLKHTPNDVAKQIAAALLEMPNNDPAAIAAKYQGWTIPLDYQTVHECLKTLKIGPYKYLGEITLKVLMKSYWHVIVGIFSIFIIMLWIIITVTQLNREIKNSHEKLESEIAIRKEVESELIKTNIELEQIFNANTDGMCVISYNFAILKINDMYAEILNIDLKNVISKKCYDVFPKSMCHTDQCPISKIMGGEKRLEYDSEEVSAKGDTIQCILTATGFYNADEELVGIVQTIKNISDRKKAEVERLRNEKLQGALEMAGAVCHEMNQPLQIILGYSDLLLEETSKQSSLYKTISIIKQQVERLGKITYNLMQITRYETKKYMNGGNKIIDINKSSNINKTS